MLCLYIHCLSCLNNFITVNLEISQNYDILDSHSGAVEDSWLLGHYTVLPGECFQNKDSSRTPQPLKVKTRHSFGMVGNTNPVTKCHIPEDPNLSCN
jgi:hypothetical protein